MDGPCSISVVLKLWLVFRLRYMGSPLCYWGMEFPKDQVSCLIVKYRFHLLLLSILFVCVVSKQNNRLCSYIHTPICFKDKHCSMYDNDNLFLKATTSTQSIWCKLKMCFLNIIYRHNFNSSKDFVGKRSTLPVCQTIWPANAVWITVYCHQ